MSYFDDNEDYLIFGGHPAPADHTCWYCGAPIFFVRRGGAPICAETGDVHRCAAQEEHRRAQTLADFEVLDD